MKALFTAFPAYGHLLPVLPLARAAAAAGAESVVAAVKDLHAAVGELPARAVGPPLPDLMAENERRFRPEVHPYQTDTHDEGSDLVEATVALFTTTR